MLRVSSTHAYQLGLAAVSKRQVAIDGHKAIARATKLEVLNLEYVSRDRRIPSTMSGYVGLGDCVRTVIVVEGGLVFFVSLVIACGKCFAVKRREMCVRVWHRYGLDGYSSENEQNVGRIAARRTSKRLFHRHTVCSSYQERFYPRPSGQGFYLYCAKRVFLAACGSIYPHPPRRIAHGTYNTCSAKGKKRGLIHGTPTGRMLQ